MSADQRVYEFKLREGLKFHNGDPFTAEDVRFSFHRAKGAKILHDKVVFAPIWENGFIRGVGPRVEEPGLSLIPAFPYSAPLEDLRLKK